MNREYELWLDESGDFVNEEKKRTKHFHASLVGGILIEASKAGRVKFDELIAESGGHVCEMQAEHKVSIVLPALERLQEEYGAEQVFFENTKYEEESSNRQLYLRIIAEGILQLLLQLDAVHESITLNVLIAQRQDVSASGEERRIGEAEYEAKLREFMLKKQRDRKLLLDENTNCTFQIEPAGSNSKLQLADFACNTRFTRTAAVFRGQEERLEKLYQKAHLFSLHELGSQNYIRMSLVQDNISDAVMELCTTRDKLDIGEEVKLIKKRMDSMSYFLVKAQMKQCMSEVRAYAIQTEDFKVGITMLEKVRKHVIPAFRESKFPVEDFSFMVLLQLSDMYLRSGDILHARQILEECRKAQEEIGNSLEAVFSYYQLIEKEALLCIDEFDYQKGADLMKTVCQSFENLMEMFSLDEHLARRFPDLRSEYYGDALCMQIYALMFLQRHHPESYLEMAELSDKALLQYPNIESELERHRQYRCHIEAEAGNYEAAIRWLLLAKGIVVCEELNEKILIHFLDMVYEQEALMARQYYMMYYLHVMSECAIYEDPLADMMYKAMVYERKLMSDVGLLDSWLKNGEATELDLGKIRQLSSNISYHPMEVVFWKFATYLCMKGQYTLAEEYYKNALEVCREKEHLTMRVTALGIFAEEIVCLIRANKQKDAAKKYKELVRMLQKIDADIVGKPIQSATRKFIKELEELIVSSERKSGRIEPEMLWSASRKVTY